MTIIEFLSKPANRELYETWVRRADTQAVLELVSQNFGPSGLNKRTGEDALYYAGSVDTYTGMMRLITHMGDLLDAHAAAAAVNKLSTDYGQTGILASEY